MSISDTLGLGLVVFGPYDMPAQLGQAKGCRQAYVTKPYDGQSQFTVLGHFLHLILELCANS
jgi:hypothetical protein